MLDLAGVHCLQLPSPPGQQTKALGSVADLVAQVVSPAAEGIDVVEVLMQALRKQEGDNVEVFVVMGGEPARVLLGRGGGVSVVQRLRRVDVLFGGEQRH